MPTKKIIIPSILENDFSQFATRLKTIETVAPLVEIDVMDGIFVSNKSFDDIKKINSLKSPVSFELHLMVDDPLSEITRWKNVKNITRVIFHIESKSDPIACINAIRANCWQAGIALKTNTPLSQVEPYYDLINVVMFMLVTIGQQSGQLVPEVGEKIKKFTALKKRPLCATDGGITKENIALVKSWGVEIFGIGSKIIKSDNPAQTFQEFTKLIS